MQAKNERMHSEHLTRANVLKFKNLTRIISNPLNMHCAAIYF